MILSLRIVSALSLSLFFFLFIGCSGTKTINTAQTNQPPEINGNLSGWDLEKSLIEQTEAVTYYATHDKDFLYLFVDVKSPAHNHAMKQSGFIIYLSNSEEYQKRTGIAFPSGTFNLLRENPSAYQSFLSDQEWFQKPQNREMIESMENQIYNRIMIIERNESSTNHGFIDKERLQIDGIQISTGDNRRLMSIEMRVPLNSSSIYNLQGNQIWMGFEIDPPNFRIQSDNTTTSRNQQGYGRGSGRSMTQTPENRRANLRQRMGQYERWFKLSLNQ